MIALLSALWFGILTSISPCPLATNIAAVSFLAKKIDHPRMVFWSGFAYTLGRMVAYVVLGMIIILSLAGVPLVANFLQKYMNKMLGPLLIIVGLFLMDILRLNFSGFVLSSKHQNKLAESGVFGSFALGIIFALSFCPISAALFFGSLIPLAVKSELGIVFPFIYGIGTGLPVLIFAVGISLGVHSLAHWFNKVAKLEIYMRKVTGAIFILVGLYYIWVYIVSTLHV
ncbi:MAG: aromatic aminobenezylarsenical efflux permease ArsG family transporter [Candidatus Omnitrophica bacterium]|nr:aromatic aminobenezylarsenical efflux permease ArsG family transporter [Candidatus Omnitrophota bacterium]